jgi:F0F1-type ATP synthase assembly protein I
MPLKNQSSKDSKTPLHSYATYSSLAFQMLAIILIGVFGGLKLDDWINTRPIFTIILTVLAVIFSIYYAIKDFIKK